MPERPACCYTFHCLQVALDVATGLQKLHRVGLAHGSVEPGSVLVLQGPPGPSQPSSLQAGAHAAGTGRSMEDPSNSPLASHTVAHRLHSKLALPLPTAQLPERRLGWAAPARLQAKVLGHFPAHVAPELLGGGLATAAGDSYAFGALLWSLWEGDFALDGGPSLAHVRGGLRPVFTSKCPSSLSQLALSCMDEDASSRPSMGQVLQALGAMQAACCHWRSPGRSLPHASQGPAAARVPGRMHLLGEEGTSGGVEQQQEDEEEDLLDALAVHRPAEAFSEAESSYSQPSCQHSYPWPSFSGSASSAMEAGPQSWSPQPQTFALGHGLGRSQPEQLRFQNSLNQGAPEGTGVRGMSLGGSTAVAHQLRRGRSMPQVCGPEHSKLAATYASQRRPSRLSMCSSASVSGPGSGLSGPNDNIPDATWLMAAGATAGCGSSGWASSTSSAYSAMQDSRSCNPPATSGSAGSSTAGGYGVRFRRTQARQQWSPRSSSSTVQLARVLLRAQAAHQHPQGSAAAAGPQMRRASDLFMNIDYGNLLQPDADAAEFGITLLS